MKKKEQNEYPKLVRDNILDIVEKKTGKRPPSRILNNKEFGKYLLKKMEEEARELSGAKNKIHITEELADIMELVDTILKFNNLNMKTVRQIQKKKRKERGGFSKRILMVRNV